MKNRNNMNCISKKSYCCDNCNKKINKGEQYHRFNVNYSGVFHICMNCYKNDEDEVLSKIHNSSKDFYDEDEEDEELLLMLDLF